MLQCTIHVPCESAADASTACVRKDRPIVACDTGFLLDPHLLVCPAYELVLKNGTMLAMLEYANRARICDEDS